MPHVFVSLGVFGSIGAVHAAAYNVTKDGFDIIAKRDSGSTDAFAVSWLAVA